MLVKISLLCGITLISLVMSSPAQAQACVAIMPGVCFHTQSVFTGGYAPGGRKSPRPDNPPSAPRDNTGDAIVGVLQALIGNRKELAASRQAFEAKYGKPLFEGKQGTWIMSGKGNEAGKACAASFLPADSSSGSAFVSFFGPDKDLPGAILFQGPAIPVVEQPQEARVILSTNDASPATIRVFQIPIAQDKSAILVPTDMIATMRGTTEATWMTLQLDGKEIFRTEMAGIMTARDAMLTCMQAS
jgi:hypothetical protein